jgi:threonine/homoserine/homoserine lactone efflux protein
MPAVAPVSGWHAFLAGSLLGLSLAAPPGPVMTVMANASMRGRLKESLKMAFGSIAGDITWLTLAILGAVTFLKSYPRVVGLMGMAGAVLLVWMAWSTWRNARAGLHRSSTPGSLKLGYFTVLTSPVSFAWWLANGILLYTTWGWPGIVGMFTALIVYSVAFSYMFNWLGMKAASAIQWVAYSSVGVLAGFSLYVGWISLHLLRS